MRTLALMIAAILWLTALPAQQPVQEPSEVIRVDVDVVNVLVSVRDKKGRIMSNLNQDDFLIYEDGKQQQIRYFARETDLPLTMGLLVDVSKSQENLIEIQRRAARRFFSEVLRPKDLAFLLSFGAEAELLQDLTGSVRTLQTALDRLRLNAAVGGVLPSPVPTANKPRGTILFDAVYLAAEEILRREVGRKAAVLITDGVDVGSRVNRDTAVESAHKSDTILYSIYYVDRSAYGFYGVSDSDLKKMSEETGGRVFKVDRKNPLEKIFTDLQEELRNQYAIGYTPTNAATDGSFRRIEVRTQRRDLKVQARKGYYAIRRGPS